MNLSRVVWALAALIGAATWPSVGLAQHHHHHNSGGGHHHHHGSHYGHSGWNYVVPHHHHHQGSYYVQDNAYYYTPAPITRLNSGYHEHRTYRPIQPVEPVQLRYGGFAQQEDLTGRLELAANFLCRDMHANYQHNQGFAQTYREAYELWTTARYMHEREHAGDHEAIRRQVQNLDRAFHHVQEEIRPWTAHAHRQIGFGGVNEKTAELEAILHHLCYDVGVKPEHGAEEGEAPRSDGEVPPAPATVSQ